ncbi:hypothetical protein CCR75_008865 [Bremia lactucae]|uniref:Bromodomain and WD repeat-containing protein 1 n=1 Tax=Bremia lactucae TaxID=4779 RepID=A0A976FEH9_BRELC|nr:hypothetical protein CCR75_008865 [Bremia lactucae]
MADDPAPLSPLNDADGHFPLVSDGVIPASFWLGDAVSSEREELPAIAAPEISGDQTIVEEKCEDAKDCKKRSSLPIVDESEVYFLIADFLKRRSVCQRTADTLIEELAEHQLLKSGIDWTGKHRAATFEDFRLRHRDISSSHLMQLLQGAAASFASLDEKKEVNAFAKNVPMKENNSLLLRSRVKTEKVRLSFDGRIIVAKELVRQLFKLRVFSKTQLVVEKVIKKYERYHRYISANRIEELPKELQLIVRTDGVGIDKVTTLAADVRAFKQLFHLRQEQIETEKQVKTLMKEAKEAGLMQTCVRTGRNQVSLLQRREISWQQNSQLPPAYVYSRIRRLKTLSGHLQIQAYCLAYDKVGKIVITGSDDRLVKIWSLQTGDLLFTLRGHVGNITDLAVNDANSLLASSSDDKTVRVWEITTGAPVAVLIGHSGVVNAVRFHPMRNIIVTASDDGRCFCYKLPEIPRTEQPETKLETARRLYSLHAYMLSLHPIYAMKHARREGIRSCKVHCVTFSRCGDFLASGGHDGIARVWDISMASALNAPTVVPRYQPTDEPQEVGVTEQQLVESIRPSLVAIYGDAFQPLQNESEITPASQPTHQFQAVAIPTTIDSMLAPTQPQSPLPLQTQESLLVPASLQARDHLQATLNLPILSVAEGTLRESTPRSLQPPQVQNDLPSSSLSDEDVPSIEPIAIMKGHKGPVSSIAYNYRGDRIVTASIKDSATRIWRWKRKYKCLTCAVLMAKESSEEDHGVSAIYGGRCRKRPIPVVDMVAWTHDDKRLITLHSVKLDDESVDPDWEQRIRIWNPESGSLIMTLGAIDKEKKNGHVNAAFALSTHPTDWRIVLTAGYDGRVFLWDISSGRMLKSFTNLSSDSKPLSNLDGGFTPDGSGFCFTDQIGRLLIFGTGSGEQYAATPVQQYFSHDYVMLITDGHYNVRDRETQELPSLMGSGPLMDASLVQYPHQPPHLLPNKMWTPREFAENRRLRILQSYESEIQCAVHHAPEGEEELCSFPLAIVKGEITVWGQEEEFAADVRALARTSFRLNGAPVMISELQHRRSGSRRNADPRQRRRRASPVEERDTSVLELEISSEDDRNDEDFEVPTPRHAAEEEDEDEDELDLDEDDTLSDDEEASISFGNDRRRRLRSTRQRGLPRERFSVRNGRRLQSDNEEKEREDAPRRLRIRRNATRSRSRLMVNSEAEDDYGDGSDIDRSSNGVISDQEARNVEVLDEVVVESNDGVIIGDNQLDRFDRSMSYDQMLDTKRVQLGVAPTPAENTDNALIPCAFCGVGNDDAMLKLPGNGMGVHPLIYGAQRVFVHDHCAIASPLCFNRDGKWYNVTREIRRGRSLVCVACSRRGATIGCTVSACPASYHWKCAINLGWSVDQLHFYCPDHQGRRTQRLWHEETDEPFAENGGAIIEPASKRFGLKFHREWLQLVSLRSIHQYVPQIGDYVVYLPEGHPGYLNYGEMPKPRYYARLSKFYAVKCRVVDVKYVFPTAGEHARCNTIKCELLIAVLAVPTTAVRQIVRNSEEKEQEGETKENTSFDTANLFTPESSPFANFTSVDENLLPSAREPTARFHFKLLYHSNDVANFLVLDHVYESGVCGNWCVGDRVQMPFVQLNQHGLEIEAKLSYGTIENIIQKPLATSSFKENSPWECVIVNWDDPEDDTCSVCPWEIESASADKRRGKRILSLRRRSTRLYISRNIVGEKCEALLQDMDQILTLSISRDFMYPVDEETFLDYPISIANPIDLTKIQQRLRLGYYRQVEAFLGDARLLSTNCEAYNIPSSPISQNSRNLVAAILTQAQRHFPHLTRYATLRETATERASAIFSYPPSDFLTNFSEDPEEQQLALLDVGLLTQTSLSSTISNDATLENTPFDVPAAVASPAITAEHISSPRRTLRLRTHSREEITDEEMEKKVDCIAEQELSVSAETSQAQSTGSNRMDESTAAASGPRRLRNREVAELPLVLTRTRRSPRATIMTASPGAGSSSRKRQRQSFNHELLTYPALIEKYSMTDRAIIERACKEDLQAVLMVFHEALMEADKADIFGNPVTNDVAPQYSEIILHPMDFGTIRDKLCKYRSFRDYFVSTIIHSYLLILPVFLSSIKFILQAHVKIVFQNAITYNGWDSFIGGLVQDLQKYCVKFLLDAAGVHLQNHKNHAKKKKLQSTTGPGNQQARSQPAAATSEEEEDSWHSNSSESEEDDDEIEDEDDPSDDSDYGVERKRRLRRPARQCKKGKIAKWR